VYLYDRTGDRKYGAAIDSLRRGLLGLPRNQDGLIMAAHGTEAELLYCVLPFLACCNEQCPDPDLVDIIMHQALTLFDLAMAGQDDGIPLQNLRPASKGWARGMGWMAAGLGKLLASPGLRGHRDRGRLEIRFVGLCKALARHQLPDGMWRSIVHDPAKPPEVTGTGLIALGMELGVQQGILDPAFRRVVDRALESLPAYSVTGTEMTACFPMNFRGLYQVIDFSGVSDQGFGIWMELLMTAADRRTDLAGFGRKVEDHRGFPDVQFLVTQPE
jgi:rhamnogalacturonyl hydrolase YesR